MQGFTCSSRKTPFARGTRSLSREIAPSDAAGVSAVSPVLLTPDGAAYAYSCLIYMSQLYVADGLR